MPRRPRNEQAGATYHVMVRGVNRQQLFFDDADYEMFTRLLATAARRQGWHVLCYCVMPNHVHALIETPEPNLGRGMQWALGLYGRYFNDRYTRVGHVFQDRFKSPVVKTDAAFVRLVAYIAVNPVAAGLCERAADWPWGSHALVAGPDPIPPWLSHQRMLSRVDGLSEPRQYALVIQTSERQAAEATLPKGSVPFGRVAAAIRGSGS